MLIIPTKLWGEADEQTPMRHWDTMCPTSCRDMALERCKRCQSESPMCTGEQHRCCEHSCSLGSSNAYRGNMSLLSRIPRSKQRSNVFPRYERASHETWRPSRGTGRGPLFPQ